MTGRRAAWRLVAVVVIAAAAIGLVVAALRLGQPPGQGSDATSPQAASTGATTSASRQRHVWLIVLENRSYRQIVGSPAAPTINALAATYGLATNYHAVARPSQPNYLALVSGSTEGITDDEIHDLAARTLLDQLDSAGLSWRVNAENVPAGCYRGAAASDGADGPGTYARKHEPAISFTSVSGDATRCARIGNLASFDPAAANFTLIVPNLCHDMHDCSVAAGDAWLKTFLPRITGSAAFADGALLLITFDESHGDDAKQHVALVYAGPSVQPGSRAGERATHYTLLRTIEEAFGLPCLAQSCAAQPMPELLGGRW